MKNTILLSTTLIASASLTNAATVITVTNASFETLTLADGANNSATSDLFNATGTAPTNTNGGGTISGWTESNTGSDHLGFTFNPTTGFTQASDGNNAAFVMNQTLSQNLSGFDIKIGDTITVTFDTWQTNGTVNTTLLVGFAGLTAQSPTGLTVGANEAAVSQSMDFIATADITAGNLAFQSTTGGQAYAIDNVTVSYVPEPSSTALLGLGGLALILRRRK